MISNNRFKVLKIESLTYTFDKRIFQVTMAVIIIFLASVLYIEGFNFKEKFYLECPLDSITTCVNPLYKNFAYCGKSLKLDSYICREEFLNPGFTFGEKPSFLFNYFSYISWAILLLGFVLNHSIHNKHFDFITLANYLKFEGDNEQENNNKGKN